MNMFIRKAILERQLQEHLSTKRPISKDDIVNLKIQLGLADSIDKVFASVLNIPILESLDK